MSYYEEFISKLMPLAKPGADRGKLATLRRGSSGELRDLVNVYPIVLQHIPERERQRVEAAYIQTACLFGIHPTRPDEWASAVTLGKAMRILRDKSDSIEARFIALLRSNREELPEHLRHAVGLAKSNDIPLRFDDILKALCRWNDNPSKFRSPQREWARDFWGPEGADASNVAHSANLSDQASSATESENHS